MTNPVPFRDPAGLGPVRSIPDISADADLFTGFDVGELFPMTGLGTPSFPAFSAALRALGQRA